jgi:hypothetical protein
MEEHLRSSSTTKTGKLSYNLNCVGVTNEEENDLVKYVEIYCNMI